MNHIEFLVKECDEYISYSVDLKTLVANTIVDYLRKNLNNEHIVGLYYTEKEK